MAIFKVAVFGVFILCIILSATASSVTHFQREWNITLNDLTSEDEIGKNNIAAYAKCNDISKMERECILFYEFLHPEGFVFKNKCYLSFSNNKGVEKFDVMKIRAATKGKVVISYISEQEEAQPKWATVYRVIDTSTCKYNESKILFDKSQLNEQLGNKFWEGNVFINDDGTFDSFLAQKDLCDGARCRVTFGPDGKMIRDPVFYLPSDMLAKDIKMYSLIKTSEHNEFFAVVKELISKNSNHHDGHIDLKLLHARAYFTSPKTVLDLNGISSFDVDDSRGALGICWSKSKGNNITDIECHQYNKEGVKTVSTSFELPYFVKTLKVKNTWANEELLLLTDECETDLCENDGRYYIRAINRLKPHNGNMEINGLNCPVNKTDINISVFNKDSTDNKICVSVSCQIFVKNEPEKSYINTKLARLCFLTKYINESF